MHISSSDFPNFDRNHNTGGNDYAESTLVTARQTIFHDAAHPSRITLPVIPGVSVPGAAVNLIRSEQVVRSYGACDPKCHSDRPSRRI